MKSMIKYSAAILMLFFSFMTNSAYSQLSEGHVKMEITDIVSSDPQVQAMADMMKGSTQEMYFTKEKGLMVMNMMGGMLKMTTLTNLTDKSGQMLYEGMGAKYLIPFSAEESELRAQENEEKMGKMNFEYDETDKKEIVGYNCYKVKISSDDMAEFKLEAYITDEIDTDLSVLQGVEGEELKGYPLEYIIDAGQFKMVYSATAINKTFDKEIFNINTKGAKEMSMEEFMNMMSSMGGGGMGF